MKLTDLLNESSIIPELQSDTKEGTINELIDLFIDDPRVKDIEKVRQSVLEREKVMSTGVGKGFAIPHGKTDLVTEILCAFGRTSNPIEYQALDAQPVNLIFLLIGKDNLVSLHIKLLSRISRMMTKENMREKLAAATTKADIMHIFKEEEETYFDL